jgi:hypothetical protein
LGLSLKSLLCQTQVLHQEIDPRLLVMLYTGFGIFDSHIKLLEVLGNGANRFE